MAAEEDDDGFVETTDAEFLRDLAKAIFTGRTGPRDLDQYHSDRLSRMARALDPDVWRNDPDPL